MNSSWDKRAVRADVKNRTVATQVDLVERTYKLSM